MSTTHHDLDHPTLERLVAELEPGSPVTMLNLLRFRDSALYPDHGDLPPCSGREAYLTRYIPAFAAAMTPYGGASVVYAGDVVGRLVGVNEEWDTIAVVTYPDINTFSALMRDPGYLRDAAPHRLAALADWGFLATQPI